VAGFVTMQKKGLIVCFKKKILNRSGIVNVSWIDERKKEIAGNNTNIKHQKNKIMACVGT